MSKASLELGGGNWAAKDGKLLGYAVGDTSGKYLPREFDFSRGADIAATRVNKDGLIEKYRENLLTYSNQFDTGWANLNSTETGGQSGYDGSSNAWKLVGNTTISRHYILQSISKGGINTWSLYAKASGHNYVQFGSASTVRQYVNFDLSDGSVGNIGSDFFSANAEDIGNGWYRLSVVDKGATNGFYISLVSSKTAGWLEDWAMPNATDGILIQDAQHEIGLVATDYLESDDETGKAGVLDNLPRIDYTSGSAQLLMEPSRTNLVAYSEYFSSWLNKPDVTIEYGYAAPDGTNSAAKITSTGSNAHIADNFGSTIVTGVYKSIWARTVSGTGTVSLLNQYAEGSVTLTEEWQRFEAAQSGPAFMYAVDFRSAANTLTEVLIWGAQAETGSYATSYIPTYGSQDTRNNDYMSLLATNFYSTTSYTYFLDINLPNDVGTTIPLWKDNDDLPSNGGFQVRKTTNTGSFVGITTHDGSSYIGLSTDVLTGRLKFAIIYDNGQVSVYYNGVQSGSAISVTGWDQSTNHFKFGEGSGGLYEPNQFSYFPTALTPQEAIALTTL